MKDEYTSTYSVSGTDAQQEIADGGPAFPRDERFLGHNGMSLRDWFAGQALAGMLSDGGSQAIISKLAREEGVSPNNLLAKAMYEFADAMIKARGK